jgi:thioredoxin 1
VKAGALVIVDFFKEDCVPCRLAEPIMESIAKRYEGRATIVKMNVGANPKTAERFQLTMVPVIAIFQDGELADYQVRAIREPTIVRKIDNVLDSVQTA